MRHLKSAMSVLVVGLALVIGLDYAALAATGNSLILGKSNTASKITKLSRTSSGPALKIKTRNGAAPMKVNSKGRVKKLNADLVDGKSAKDFAPAGAAPLAVGVANTNGTLRQSKGVASSTYEAASNRYRITLTGINYYYLDFATQVTPTCGDTIARTASVGGDLLVYLRTSTGAPTQCSFAFVTHGF